MKHKIKFNLLIIFWLALGYKTNAQEKVNEKTVRNYLVTEMRIQHIPGLAYSVIKKGKVLTTGVIGEANLTWGAYVTPNTLFQMASASKVYCGVLLARLFDQGIFSVQDSLGNLLHDIPQEWKAVKLTELASHQSGIKSGNFGINTTSKEAFEIAKKQPFEFKPGMGSAYISSDFWILQYVIEQKTGLTYFSALKKYVLDPLLMHDSNVNNVREGMARTSDVLPREATVYHYDSQLAKYRIGDFPFTASGYAAGGIFTSINDFNKLIIALDNGTFLSPESYRLLTTAIPLKTAQEGHYGLGTIVRNYENHKLVEHSGGPALADFSRFEDDHLTVIVLTNQRGVYPYLAKSVASFYISGLPKQTIPKDYR